MVADFVQFLYRHIRCAAGPAWQQAFCLHRLAVALLCANPYSIRINLSSCLVFGRHAGSRCLLPQVHLAYAT